MSKQVNYHRVLNAMWAVFTEYIQSCLHNKQRKETHWLPVNCGVASKKTSKNTRCDALRLSFAGLYGQTMIHPL